MNTPPDGDRRRLVSVAMTPATVVTVIAVVLVGLIAFTSGASLEDIDKPIGLALIAGVLLTFAVLTWGWSVVNLEAREVANRAAALKRGASRSKAELASARDQLTQLETELKSLKRREASTFRSTPAEPPRADPGHVHVGDLGARGPRIEVFVDLARRLQSLIHRGIGTLDQLENEVEDPDLLKGLHQVDHLANRLRRHTENLAVLTGAVPHRQWSRPVSVSDVLRSAIAEIEHHSRVQLVPPAPGTIRAHAVADLVHLLTELAENATVFSPPSSRVLLRVERVAAGLAVEVEDRGSGMGNDERNRLNALLGSPAQDVPAELLRDGRIGLYVVSSLARRHGIVVQLQGNIYGGTQAVLVLPHQILDDLSEPPEREPMAPEAVSPAALPPVPASPPALPPAALPADTAPRHSAPPPRPQGRATVRRAPEYEELDQEAAEPASPRRLSGPVATQARRASHARETADHDMDTSAHPVVEPPSTRSETDEGPRPVLPRRRRQEQLDLELLKPPRDEEQVEEVAINPQLMAAFQAGFRMGEDFSEPGDSSEPGGEPQGRK